MNEYPPDIGAPLPETGTALSGTSSATLDERARKKKKKATGTCALCGREVPARELFPLDALRPTIADRIRQEHPDLPPDALVSRGEIDRLRSAYIGDILKQERGELSVLEKEVLESLHKHETLSENIEDEFDQDRTFGDKVSDHMASFGGSWYFLTSFAVVLCIWMAYNAWRGEGSAFDPYPFILLNLVLSCLAAIQAPVIMMSQRRQEVKDRLRAFNDYRVNLKAELEIRHLHEKLDHVLKSQWERLAELQEMQLEMLQDMGARRPRAKV